MNVLVNRNVIDQFMFNNNVVLYVDFYEKDDVRMTDREQIKQFVHEIDFDLEVTEERFQHRVDYFNIDVNKCELTDFVNSLDQTKVLLVHIDSLDCDCYFVID